ncbi:hypothetical protein [Jeotgalibacillus terrae]|uniref:Uncharacterized protein n=1 Tax=Jeotgalibacillus terrae TaxID=587735 RepID=A0ABW5ZJQ9_9BACL|nr:hypothetical protein [Jeotgalibacillus terrae]MBM7578564.1 hypothetical protein [Jeotgalibacillus terrae]
MEVVFSLLILSIALILLGMKKRGDRTITVKKLVLGLVATIVVINVILFVIL